MQIWTFSKHHIFKYDFWEKTQYSNMNFWCFLVTPAAKTPRKGNPDREREEAHPPDQYKNAKLRFNFETSPVLDNLSQRTPQAHHASQR